MTLPPRTEPAHQMKLGDCQYRDCYTLAQFKARELEIIEACKAVCESIGVAGSGNNCADTIDELKEQL